MDSTSIYMYSKVLRNIYFALSIPGLIFTSILLYILLKKLRKSKHNDLILTLLAVLADSVSSGGLLFRAIFTQYPYNILKEHYSWCYYDAMINSVNLLYSGYILGILSVQRMLLIVFNLKVSIYIWISISCTLYFTILGAGIYISTLASPSLSIVEVFCLIKGVSSSKTFYTPLITCTLLTYLLTIISYLAIIIFSCKQCLEQLTLNLDKSIVYRECRTIIFKSLFFLIPYMVIYFGRVYCWLYEMITGNSRTFIMEYVSIILLSSAVIVNCFTILYMNKEINKEFFNFITKVKDIIHR
ncbi:hypothetical protein CONCODRAFT_13497 [Conidiobolus coronatus NRRL 28638]|uniref:G-protein coupled receptors family 1 profile domain-containing protein n=1 Tax=Conidiobolus coronatus (strain ATCC 28846 / CBS 209.66 / NRRL 28638) TaxID=796925 RepID=A0A137NQR1_CONC2|nr:hypothetical protein CONCODRAFT_13497 [Conidiobolus coronatus NRRL 28638]|eukprot:KXN65052.1 hypothetical protein CONCODRAFT_13497 [Conidiobolus coronatus NRRL 28638]